jgi:hypothetical protein
MVITDPDQRELEALRAENRRLISVLARLMLDRQLLREKLARATVLAITLKGGASQPRKVVIVQEDVF